MDSVAVTLTVWLRAFGETVERLTVPHPGAVRPRPRFDSPWRGPVLPVTASSASSVNAPAGVTCVSCFHRGDGYSWEEGVRSGRPHRRRRAELHPGSRAAPPGMWSRPWVQVAGPQEPPNPPEPSFPCLQNGRREADMMHDQRQRLVVPGALPSSERGTGTRGKTGSCGGTCSSPSTTGVGRKLETSLFSTVSLEAASSGPCMCSAGSSMPASLRTCKHPLWVNVTLVRTRARLSSSITLFFDLKFLIEI